MAAFKAVRELNYEKPPSETLSDIEKAFVLIGKVQKVDSEARKIQGKTKYGINRVKINAQVEVIDGKTKILFNGKSDDFGRIGLQKGIDNLINTMQNLDNTEYIPSKTAGVKPLWVISLVIEIFLAMIIGFGLRSVNFPPGLLIVLIIVWVAIFVYLVLSRIKASKAKR